MGTRRTLAGFAFLVALSSVVLAQPQAQALPDRLTNEEFWRLSQDMSEPDGSFRSDNLVSNERYFQWVIPDLVRRVRQGSVYLGVGPEQNFTYIAALKPKMVFITDVRRGNLHMHLMYKALFELSKNRVDFVELMFNKKRPPNVTAESTGSQLINAFWDVITSSEAEYKANLRRVLDHLTKTRGLPLGQGDLDGVEYVYWSFYWYGLAITYNSSTTGRAGMISYGDLMIEVDGAGINRSFLSSEASFQVLKDLHERNMFVPVVGNFAGPKALRAVGKYVRDRQATIGAMYLSNVEQYLYMDGIWNLFCGNVASMPLDEQSTFIRSSAQGGGGGGGGSNLMNGLGSMLTETKQACGLSERAGVR